MTCPCGLCEERYLGCHAQCDAYRAWNSERMAEREKMYQRINRKDMLDGFKAEAIRKAKRGKQR